MVIFITPVRVALNVYVSAEGKWHFIWENKFLYLISVQHWTCHLKFIHFSLYCSAWHCASRVFLQNIQWLFFSAMVPVQKYCNWTLCVELSTLRKVARPSEVHTCCLLQLLRYQQPQDSQCVDCEADTWQIGIVLLPRACQVYLSVSWDCTTGSLPGDWVLSHSIPKWGGERDYKWLVFGVFVL